MLLPPVARLTDCRSDCYHGAHLISGGPPCQSVAASSRSFLPSLSPLPPPRSLPAAATAKRRSSFLLPASTSSVSPAPWSSSSRRSRPAPPPWALSRPTPP